MKVSILFPVPETAMPCVKSINTVTADAMAQLGGKASPAVVHKARSNLFVVLTLRKCKWFIILLDDYDIIVIKIFLR